MTDKYPFSDDFIEKIRLFLTKFEESGGNRGDNNGNNTANNGVEENIYFRDKKSVDEKLTDFLDGIAKTVEILTEKGESKEEILKNYTDCGEFLLNTSGSGFYADVQIQKINDGVTLYCFQTPGGGSIFLFDTEGGIVMVDTGYGIYADDAKRMFKYYGLDISRLKFIIVTHADSDHCGAGGAYDVPAYMHPGTLEIIRCGNRAWGSIHESSTLEKVYTTMIAYFSHWNPSKEKNIRLFPEDSIEKIGNFAKLGTLPVGNITINVLLSDGGHQFGQLILYSEDANLLFTADTLMNFTSFDTSRRNYNSIADFLVTSVNVDSELARKERKSAVALALEHEAKTGRKCLICGGHGTISVLNSEGKPETLGSVEHYTPKL